MSNDDHDRLIRVAANWYGLYNELFVKAQRLTDDNARLRTALQSLYDAAPDAKRIILTDEAAKRLYDARRNARVVLGGGNE